MPARVVFMRGILMGSTLVHALATRPSFSPLALLVWSILVFGLLVPLAVALTPPLVRAFADAPAYALAGSALASVAVVVLAALVARARPRRLALDD